MSTSPTCGENDLVDICTKEELVSFNHVSPLYPPHKHVTVHYSLGSGVGATPRDWIGIFPSVWQDICHPLVFQWAPVHPLHKGKSHERLAVFPANLIKPLGSETESYQFLYVTKGKQVLGVSQPFRIKHQKDKDKDAELYNLVETRTQKKSRQDSPGKSESPVLLSSDEEWDFANQSNAKRDGSSASDLSDIVVLSTSPSKESAKLKLKWERSVAKGREEDNKDEALKSFSLSTEDNPTDSQNSDLEEEIIPPSVPKKSSSEPRKKNGKSSKKSGVVAQTSNTSEPKEQTQRASDKISSKSKTKRSGKGHGRIIESKTDKKPDNSKFAAPLASKLLPCDDAVTSWVKTSSDFLNSPVSMSVFEKLKIVNLTDSDYDDDNYTEARTIVEKMEKSNAQHKIEVIVDSSDNKERSTKASNRKSKPSTMAELVSTSYTDGKIAKKSKQKKQKRKQEEILETAALNNSEVIAESKVAMASDGSSMVTPQVENAITSVVFDELSAVNKKPENKSKQHSNHKAKKEKCSDHAQRKRVDESAVENEVLDSGVDFTLSDNSKREMEKEARHVERKNKRRLKRLEEVSKEITVRDVREVESDAKCSDDGNEEAWSVSNAPCHTAKDEFKAIKKKYVQTQKIKSKKRKRMQSKNAMQVHCNLAVLFNEDQEEEPVVASTPQPAEDPKPSPSTQENKISSLILEDTSEQGFPALPTVNNNVNVSKQVDPETTDQPAKDEDECEEKTETPPDETKFESSEEMELTPPDSYVPPYLLDIMDNLPPANNVPDNILMDWKQGAQPLMYKLSLERFKAKYKTKSVKKQDLRRMKFKRKSLYLNSGILERIKQQLSNCMEKTPVANVRLTPSDGQPNATLTPPSIVLHPPEDDNDKSVKDFATYMPASVPYDGVPGKSQMDYLIVEDVIPKPCKPVICENTTVCLVTEATRTKLCTADDSLTLPKTIASEKTTDRCDSFEAIARRFSANPNDKAVAEKMPVLSYASVVKNVYDDHTSGMDSGRPDKADYVTIEMSSEDSHMESSEPVTVIEVKNEPESCSITDLIQLPEEMQQLVTTAELDNGNVSTTPGPGMSKAAAKARTKAMKLIKERQNIRQQLRQRIESVENTEPKTFFVAPPGGTSVPLEGSEYMRGNCKKMPPASSPLKWPLARPVDVLSSINSWVPAERLQEEECRAESQPPEEDCALHLRPMARVHAHPKCSCTQSPPRVAKSPEPRKDPVKQSVEHISQIVNKTEQMAALDVALANSLAENKNLKDKMRRMENQLEEMEGQLQQLERDQSNEDYDLPKSGSQAPHNKGKIKDIRHRRVAVCKSTGDMKTLVRSNVEVISLKSKVKSSDLEINCLENQISALKEALRSESKKASKAHLKWLKMKMKVKMLKTRLKSYEGSWQGQMMSDIPEVMDLSEGEDVDDADLYEPPTKRRRLAPEMSPEKPNVHFQSPKRNNQPNSRDTSDDQPEILRLQRVIPRSSDLQRTSDGSCMLSDNQMPSTSGSAPVSSPVRGSMALPSIHLSTSPRKSTVTGMYGHSESGPIYSSPPTAYMQPLGPYVMQHSPCMPTAQTLYWPPPTSMTCGGQSCHASGNPRNSPPHLPLPHLNQTSPSAPQTQHLYRHYSPTSSPRAVPGQPSQHHKQQQQQHQHCLLQSPTMQRCTLDPQCYKPSRRSTPPLLPLPSPPYPAISRSQHPRQASASPPRHHGHTSNRCKVSHQSRATYHRDDSPPRVVATKSDEESPSGGNIRQHCLNPFQQTPVQPPTYNSLYTQEAYREPMPAQNHGSFLFWNPGHIAGGHGPYGMCDESCILENTCNFSSHCPTIRDSPSTKASLKSFQAGRNSCQSYSSSNSLAFASNAAVCHEHPQSGSDENLQKQWSKSKEDGEVPSFSCEKPLSDNAGEEAQWRNFDKNLAYQRSSSPPLHDVGIELESQYQSHFMRQLVKNESNEQQYQLQQQQSQIQPPQQLHQIAKEQSQHQQMQSLQQHPTAMQNPFLHSSSSCSGSFVNDAFSVLPSSGKQNPFRLFQRDRRMHDGHSSEHCRSEEYQQKPMACNGDFQHLCNQNNPVGSSPISGNPTEPNHDSARLAKQGSASFQNTKSVVELNVHGLIGNPIDSTCFSCGSPFDGSVDKRLIEARVAKHQNPQE